MPRRKTAKTAGHFAALPLEDRILIYLGNRDRQRGRGVPGALLQNDATEAFIEYSSAYLHWHFEVIANTIAWPELREISSIAKPTFPLAPGQQALAALPAGIRRRYLSTLKGLLAKGEVHLFAEWFRALQGFGGTVVPMLALWTKLATDSPNPVAAVTLTATGFSRATALSDAFREVRPWQLHELQLTVKGFRERMLG